jgi:hypothetical protein
MGREVLLDLGHRSAEFFSRLAITRPPERAEPLVGMSAAQTVVRERTPSPRLRPL